MLGLQTSLVILYALVLVRLGCSDRPRFASWHMFVTASRATLELHARGPQGQREPINPWDHLPHTGFALGLPAVQCLLAYLAHVHGLSVWGTVTLDEPQGIRTFTVEAGHLRQEPSRCG